MCDVQNNNLSQFVISCLWPQSLITKNDGTCFRLYFLFSPLFYFYDRCHITWTCFFKFPCTSILHFFLYFLYSREQLFLYLACISFCISCILCISKTGVTLHRHVVVNYFSEFSQLLVSLPLCGATHICRVNTQTKMFSLFSR